MDRAAKRLGVSPEECLYVGDGASQEQRGAHEAGMRTLLLLHLLRESYPDVDERRARETDYVAETFGDMLALIRRLVSEAGN